MSLTSKQERAIHDALTANGCPEETWVDDGISVPARVRWLIAREGNMEREVMDLRRERDDLRREIASIRTRSGYHEHDILRARIVR